MTYEFPGNEWAQAAPEDVGLDAQRLEDARRWMDEHTDERGYRFLIVRDGYLVYERYQGIEPEQRLPIASAAKSVYSNVLGIEIAGMVHFGFPEGRNSFTLLNSRELQKQG